MKEELRELLNKVRMLRGRAFNEHNEELHNHLGRAMANLIKAIELVK